MVSGAGSSDQDESGALNTGTAAMADDGEPKKNTGEKIFEVSMTVYWTVRSQSDSRMTTIFRESSVK
jgi:hypothetical protein